MKTFADVETVWLQRLGNLRNVVRQHVVTAQLAEHLSDTRTVLDVGCGQGTQAVALARRGLQVTGMDPSDEMLTAFRRSADEAGVAVRAVQGEISTLRSVLAGQLFDLVCAHGVLMYVEDGCEALGELATYVAPDGRLSFTVRNADALAMRPGVRGEFAKALSALTTSQYINETGAAAQAHHHRDVTQWIADLGLELEAWYGVRVLTDAVDPAMPPDPTVLDDCLTAEVEAGRTDPYRWMGSQFHFIAGRPATT